MARKSFDDWMRKVKEKIVSKCFAFPPEMVEYPFRQWYEEGKDVDLAATKAVFRWRIHRR